MYKRSEFHLIKGRFEEPRRFIQVVMGPRQIGKSTVVKQVLNKLKLPFQFYSADNVPATNRAWIANCWAATRAQMESNREKYIIHSVVGIEVKGNADKRTDGLEEFRKRFNPKQVS